MRCTIFASAKKKTNFEWLFDNREWSSIRVENRSISSDSIRVDAETSALVIPSSLCFMLWNKRKFCTFRSEDLFNSYEGWNGLWFNLFPVRFSFRLNNLKSFFFAVVLLYHLAGSLAACKLLQQSKNPTFGFKRFTLCRLGFERFLAFQNHSAWVFGWKMFNRRFGFGNTKCWILNVSSTFRVNWATKASTKKNGVWSMAGPEFGMCFSQISFNLYV